MNIAQILLIIFSSSIFVFCAQLRRYKTYVYALSSRILAEQQNEYQNGILAADETIPQGYQQLSISLTGSNILATSKMTSPQIPLNQQQQQNPQSPINRYNRTTLDNTVAHQQDIG